MELRSCYFCGSIGESLDAHRVVPDRPAPETDPLRIVLCTDCHAKLDRVLDAVPDGAGLEDVDGSSDATPDLLDPAGSADTPTAGPSDRSTADASDDDVGFEFPDGITFDDADATDDPSGRAVAIDEESGEGDATGGGETGTAADASEGGGVDVVPGPSAGTEDGDDADGTRSGTAADGSDGGSAGGDPDESSGTGGRRGSDASDDSSGSLRRLGKSGTSEYRKALRLLRNREFPMARSDLVDVMSSAYELETEECDRIVDFAVDRGWVVDDGGQLRRN